MQGSFHQNSVRFCAATHRRQCFPSCAVSLAYAKFQRHVSRWTPADLDFVLTTGDTIPGTLLIQKPNLGHWVEMSDILAPFLVDSTHYIVKEDTSVYGGLNLISGYGIRSSLDEEEQCIIEDVNADVSSPARSVSSPENEDVLFITPLPVRTRSLHLKSSHPHLPMK